MKICVSGSKGKMGGRIIELSKDDAELELVGSFDVDEDAEIPIAACECLIEFTSPQATIGHLAVCEKLGKAMVIGNGGSAAIASHLQNDLCNAVGIRALAFQEPPRLTAISNDRGYGGVFEEPVELWASDGDLLIAISSSGQSANILRAVKAAQARGCHIITLSGFSAHNPLRSLGNVNLYVASQEYGYVEAAHSVLAHFLTDCAMMAHPRDEA